MMSLKMATKVIARLDEKMDSGRSLTPVDQRRYNEATTAWCAQYVRSAR